MKKKKYSINNIQDFVSKIIFKKKIPKNFLKVEILSVKNLDSFFMIKTIVNIEQKYKIKFHDKEIFSKKFKNIKGISFLIQKKIKEI